LVTDYNTITLPQLVSEPSHGAARHFEERAGSAGSGQRGDLNLDALAVCR
jgi:hypothetical protein